MLWWLMLSQSSENNELSGLTIPPVIDINPGSQNNFLTQSTVSPQPDDSSSPMVVATASATVNESVEVQDVSVWGSIQTESGAVTHHDRVLFYSLSLGKSYDTFSDPNGYFYIDRMTPAIDYSLWVLPAGMFRGYVRKNFTISVDQTEFSVILGELPVGTLSGHLVNAVGDAVPNFGIKIRSSEKDTWAATFITDRFGYFQVDQVPLGSLEFSSTYGPALRITGHEFNLDQQSSLTLIVDQGHYEVNAMVFDQFNNPVGGANVVLNWLSTAGGMRSVVTRQRITNATGQFSMKQVGSGEHDLVISATDGSTYRQTIDINSLSSALTVFLRPVP